MEDRSPRDHAATPTKTPLDLAAVPVALITRVACYVRSENTSRRCRKASRPCGEGPRAPDPGSGRTRGATSPPRGGTSSPRMGSSCTECLRGALSRPWRRLHCGEDPHRLPHPGTREALASRDVAGLPVLAIDYAHSLPRWTLPTTFKIGANFTGGAGPLIYRFNFFAGSFFFF